MGISAYLSYSSKRFNVIHTEVLYIHSLLNIGVPKPAAKDASVSSDASSLWVFYSKEFIGLLEKSSTTLIALAGGFHCEGMISDEVNSTILDNSETKKGPQMFFDAVKQLLGAEPRSIHKVLDLMDVQEQLCGLVRRMKEDLGAQEG